MGLCNGTIYFDGDVTSLTGLNPALPASRMTSRIRSWSNQSVGKWSQIEFSDDGELPISVELSMVGVKHAPVEGYFTNEPPPSENCTDCAPQWTPEKLTVAFERITDSEKDCAMVVGTSNTPVYDGTVSIRQQPPSKACPLRLYVWVPHNTSGVTRTYKQSVPDDACNGDLGVIPGSSAMIANTIYGGSVQRELTCSHMNTATESVGQSVTKDSTPAIVVFVLATTALVGVAAVYIGKTFFAFEVVEVVGKATTATVSGASSAAVEEDMRV